MAQHGGFPSTVETTREVETTDIVAVARARPTALETSAQCEYSPDLVWGTYAPAVIAMTGKQWGGLLAHSFGDECIFERIWIYPALLDFGFIVADAEDTFEVWNAYTHRTVELTSVTLSGDSEGIAIDTPATPFDLSPFAWKTFTVDVTLEGPTTQDTTYTIIVDGETRRVDVTGTRTIAVEQEPDWRRSPTMRYAFETALFQNPYFLEQRRPLLPLPWRTLEVDYIVSGLEAQRLLNALTYGHDRPFAVFLYQEKMTPTAATAGTTTITVTETTTDFWNLTNLATHVALVDHGERAIEVKIIDSLAANAIEVTTDIVDTFDLDATVVYPVFFGLLQSVTVRPETDDDVIISARFQEYSYGG